MKISDEQLLSDLMHAYYDARRNKRRKDYQLNFELKLESELIRLRNDLQQRTYRPEATFCFIVTRPVRREVFASHFRDRIIHHLLYNYIAPLFEREFIYDCYSCRPGKGTLKGIQRFEHHIRSCSDNYREKAYVLQMDFTGYFMSIDKKIMLEILTDTLTRKRKDKGPDGRKWEDRVDMDLVDFLIRSILLRDPTDNCHIIGPLTDWDPLPANKSLLKTPPGIGMPIGDLTSQLFSNIYLNELDQYVKRELHCRHYGRYVDDLFIVHRDKEFLKRAAEAIRNFSRGRLHLRIHPHKTRLHPVSQDSLFLGACVKPWRRYLSERTVASLHRCGRRIESYCRSFEELTPEQVASLIPVLNSYCGYARHFKAGKILTGTFGQDAFLHKYVFFPGGHFRKAKAKKKYRKKNGNGRG